MRHRALYTAVIAAGFLATAGSSVALATTQPTTTTTPPTTTTTTTTPTTTPPNSEIGIAVQPASAYPGANVLVLAECAKANVGQATSTALEINPFVRATDGLHQTAKATVHPDAKPGTYQVTFVCGSQPVSTTFTVLAKQVTKVPTGAPQTGGGAAATEFTN